MWCISSKWSATRNLRMLRRPGCSAGDAIRYELRRSGALPRAKHVLLSPMLEPMAIYAPRFTFQDSVRPDLRWG
jgi:hypothetical protein